MKHVGLVVYLKANDFWWSNECGMYLLGEYQNHNEMCNIAEYQKQRRFYMDEITQESK